MIWRFLDLGQDGLFANGCNITMKLRLAGRRAPRTNRKIKELSNGASKLLGSRVTELHIEHFLTDKEGERTGYMRWKSD